MKLQTRYRGRDHAFEGDRVLLLQELPVGAQITAAVIRLTPVAGPTGQVSVEHIDFDGTSGGWGATKTLGSTTLGGVVTSRWMEIDFHARRTLHRVQGTAVVTGAELQIDLGGAFVRMGSDGSLWVPGDPSRLIIDLSPNGATLLPGLVVTRLRLHHVTDQVDLRRITVLSHATNVHLGLDRMPPFWTRTGELTETQTTPDFSEMLQAYLAEAPAENGVYRVPIRLHSDLITRLDVAVTIEYSRQVETFPDGLDEVVLPFNYASLPNAQDHLLNVTVPKGARVVAGSTTARVIGGFADTRVALGQTGIVAAGVEVPVSAGLSQAQPVLIPAGEELPIKSIDLLLAAVTRTAEVNINFMPDSDGKPFGDTLLDQPASISLTRDTEGSLTWVNAELSRELLFKPDKLERLWLVVQVAEGEVVWGADAAPQASEPALQFSDSGGLAWRVTTHGGLAGLAAYFRLRNKPPRFQVPIELRVGAGDGAKRVALDRFQPTNRVDYRLDFDEVAETINEVLQSGAGDNPEEVELIVNGDFSRWPPTAFNPTSPFSMPLLGSPPIAVAAAPFGATAYVLSRFDNAADGGTFQIFDLACGKQNQITIPTPPMAFVLNPSGTRAYIIANGPSELHVIDTTLFAEIGLVRRIPGNVGIVAIQCHPNGNLLYLAVLLDGGRTQVWVVDVRELEQRILLSAPALPVIAQVDLNQDGILQAMEIPPDGQSLFLAAARPSSLHVMDTATNRFEEPITLGIVPRSFALARDGDRALIADGNRIQLIDPATAEVIMELDPAAIGAGVSAPFPIRDVAFSSDGNFAIAARSSVLPEPFTGVRVFDLQTGMPPESIDLDQDPIALTTVPADQAIMAVSTETLTVLQTGNPGPIEWQLTAGTVNPIALPGPFHGAVSLGHSEAAGPTGFSQVVPLVGGLTYRFQFYGHACDSGAFAEVRLVDALCERLHKVEIPIASEEQEQVTAAWNGLALHELAIETPAEAVQAEVRFIVPLGNTAVIDRVSLMVTTRVVVDGSLTEMADDKPAHWQLAPENASGLSFTPGKRGTLIENTGEETVTLGQTHAIEAAKPFVAELRADATHAEIEPKLELRWIAEAGNPAPAVLVVSAAASENRIMEGTVPEGTSQVELRLLVPPESSLDIEQLSLTQPQNTVVPITLVAQAPGEVTVTDARLNYELDPLPRPPVPAQGLCEATSPDGESKGDCCYCPCCGCDKTMEDPQAALSMDDRPVLLGTCLGCGGRLVRSGGALAANARRVSLTSLSPTRRVGSPEKREVSPRVEPEKDRAAAVKAKAKKPKTKPAPTKQAAVIAQKETKPVSTKGEPHKDPPAPPRSKAKKPTAASTKRATRMGLAKAIRALLEDPQLRPLVERAFKLTTIKSWSVARLAKHLERG